MLCCIIGHFFGKIRCNDIDVSGNAGQLFLYFVQQLKLPFPFQNFLKQVRVNKVSGKSSNCVVISSILAKKNPIEITVQYRISWLLEKFKNLLEKLMSN